MFSSEKVKSWRYGGDFVAADSLVYGCSQLRFAASFPSTTLITTQPQTTTSLTAPLSSFSLWTSEGIIIGDTLLVRDFVFAHTLPLTHLHRLPPRRRLFHAITHIPYSVHLNHLCPYFPAHFTCNSHPSWTTKLSLPPKPIKTMTLSPPQPLQLLLPPPLNFVAHSVSLRIRTRTAKPLPQAHLAHHARHVRSTPSREEREVSKPPSS